MKKIAREIYKDKFDDLLCDHLLKSARDVLSEFELKVYKGIIRPNTQVYSLDYKNSSEESVDMSVRDFLFKSGEKYYETMDKELEEFHSKEFEKDDQLYLQHKYEILVPILLTEEWL